MYLNFSVHKQPFSAQPLLLDTIYNLRASSTYYSRAKMLNPKKYFLVYTLSGKGTITCDEHQFLATPCTLVLFNASHFLEYGTVGEEWYFWWFEFFMDELPLTSNMSYNLFLDSFELSLCEKILYYAQQNVLDLSCSLFSSLLFSVLYKLNTRPASCATLQLINKCTALIYENIDTICVSDLCTSLHLSERTLRNLFNKFLDTSPKAYINELRLKNALILLDTTILTLTEIAEQLGYSSPSHLSSCFKKHYGCSPQQYRQLI